MEPEIISHFVESVGQKADVDLYLKYFRAQKRESFAIIAADASIVERALDPFHFDLRILAGLGLVPVVLLGLFDAKDADAQAQRVYDWLVEDAVPARIVRAGAGGQLDGETLSTVLATMSSNQIPIVTLEAAKGEEASARFGLLQRLAEALETAKIVFLSTSAGLEKEGAPRLSVVNLPTDLDRMLEPGLLSRRHNQLLRHVTAMLNKVHHRMSVAVVSPLGLLRELFTIAGAGTLIRKGSKVVVRNGLDNVDRGRLRTLLESAFGRRMFEGVLDRTYERTYYEDRYLGAVLLARSPAGVYLSKFAVERQAQGEGIGGDLWSAITRDYASFFWRARVTNPINSWYARQADGLLRLPEWHVFWKGLGVAEIEPAIRYALELPPDFAPEEPAA